MVRLFVDDQQPPCCGHLAEHVPDVRRVAPHPALVGAPRPPSLTSVSQFVSGHEFLKEFETPVSSSRFWKQQKTKRSEPPSADVCGVR